VKEQSHKQEMASLVQADFARLRARGVETTLAANREATEVHASPPEQLVVAERTTEDMPAAKSTDSWIIRLLRTR
jgi:hypothetical protein